MRLLMLFVTVIGSCIAPRGAATVICVVEELRTTAFLLPKYTVIFEALLWKPEPVIVTVVFSGPDFGLKFVMIGCANALLADKKRLHATKQGKVFCNFIDVSPE